MKTTTLTLLLLATIAFIAFKPNDNGPLNKNAKIQNDNPSYIFDSKNIDGNNIDAWFRNNGSFNRNPITNNSGFEWPNGSNKVLRYSSGLWIAGKTGSDTTEAVSNHFTSEYLPGYIDENGVPQGMDDPDFRVYKIAKGDTTSLDYLNWPVDQGAYLDSNNKPFLPGTQTLFYSMSDGYAKYHYYTPEALKAQIQVTSWCYNSVTDPVISNTIFTEFKVINRNSLPWNDAVISFWSDECSNDQIAVGCDTNLNLGYAYCAPNSWQYENNPPAFGFLLLQGPAEYTGNSDDTVLTYIPGNNNRIMRIGYKEIVLSSFNMFQNASFYYKEPSNYKEIYSTMQGLFFNDSNWVNPINSHITKFPFSGDPESGTGWYQSATMNFGNRRLLMNFGFLNIEPGDTQSVIIAQIVSQGSNNLNSVTKLKQNSQYIKNVFENNFTTVSVNESNNIILPSDFKLYQNYPNPFNPVTKIRYNLSKAGQVTLKVFDISGKEVITLINGRKDAGDNEVSFSATDGSNILSSGIYFYRLTVDDRSSVMKMVLQK
jgi:hypothetical protein